MHPRIKFVLIRYDGAKMDISSRVGRAAATISEQTEIELAELTHGDLNITVRDLDGAVEHFLGTLDETRRFTLTLDRDTPNVVRRRKVRRLFHGVLDLPWSVSFDRKERTIKLQVFSYSKRLDQQDASTVVRTFPGLLGTVNTLNVLDLNTTSHNLRRGDKFTIFDTSSSENHVVDYVDEGSAQIRTVSDFVFAFVNAEIVVTTPSHRYITPSALAALLFAQATDVVGSVDLSEPIAEVPILQPMNISGLPSYALANFPGRVGCIVESADNTLHVRAGGATTLQLYYQVDGPDKFWDRSGSASVTIGDWRPYLISRPVNFPTYTGVRLDDSTCAWDHENNRAYKLVVVTVPATSSTLELHRNGAFLAQIHTYAADTGYTVAKLEYDPINDQVWCAYSGGATNVIEIYDVASAAQTTVTAATSGKLRFMRGLSGGRMIWLSEDGTIVRIYTLGTSAAVERTLDTASGIIPSRLWWWTLRYSKTRIFACYDAKGRTRIRIWSSSWSVLADYDFGATNGILSRSDQTPQISMIDHATHGQLVVAWNGFNTWGILSDRIVGVIEYADTDGISCGGALKEIALATMTVVTADPFRRVRLLPRNRFGQSVRTIQEALDVDERPIWDFYRTTATVSGKDADGESFEETAGQGSGDDSKRLEISARFVQTPSLAVGLADAYASTLSVRRRQMELTSLESRTDDPLRPLDRLRYGSREWFVIEAKTDLFDMEQDLRIVEVVESSASATVTLSPPTDFPSLVGWYRPESLTAVASFYTIADGGVFSPALTWEDSSGNGQHFTQTGVGNLYYIANATNGLSAVETRGGALLSYVLPVPIAVTFAGPLTIACIQRTTTAAGNMFPVGGRTGGSNTNDGFLSPTPSLTDELRLYSGSSTATIISSAVDSSQNAVATYYVDIIRRNASNVWFFRRSRRSYDAGISDSESLDIQRIFSIVDVHSDSGHRMVELSMHQSFLSDSAMQDLEYYYLTRGGL